MKSLPSYLIILLVFSSSLFAQENTDDEPVEQKNKGRLAWIVTTGIPSDIENPVTIMTGKTEKNITQVTLSKRSPSQPIKIPKSGIIKIVKQVPNPEEPEKPKWITLAKALVSNDVGKAMIILVPVRKKEGSTLRFSSKVMDLAGFRGGDALYINLSRQEVAVKLGDEALKLNPGKMKIHSARGIKKSTNKPVSYHYFHPVKKRWKLISASTVVIRPTRREICIFSWDMRFKRLTYHGVTFPVSE